jgi:hypothetical protein
LRASSVFESPVSAPLSAESPDAKRSCSARRLSASSVLRNSSKSTAARVSIVGIAPPSGISRASSGPSSSAT